MHAPNVNAAWMLFRREPYRLLFPLAWLWGLLATGYWVAVYAGWMNLRLPIFHGYLSMLGFGGGIASGFLLTALPMFLSSRPSSTPELWIAVACSIALGTGALLNETTVCLLAFFALNALIITFILLRFDRRTGAPPPVTYIACGLAHGLVGSALAVLQPEAFPLIGNRMIEQGFLLSLILGIGSFLGARFLGTFQPPALLFRFKRHGRPVPPPVMMQRVFLLGGALVFASFWIETGWSAFAGKLMRAAVVAFQFVAFARIYRRPQNPAWAAQALWWSYWFTATGLFLAALLPAYEIAALHVTYIGGFGLMMLVMGFRVLSSHGGVEPWWLQARWLPAWIGSAAVLASGVRVAAHFAPQYYLALLAVAAGVWLTALLFWGMRLLPLVSPGRRPS